MIETKSLFDETYVVFDLETTGLNPSNGDSIIEIGAVKMNNGLILDRYNELINPNQKLNGEIIDITGIDDSMLCDKRTEEPAIIDFMNWVGDSILVAHNAKFDISFIESAYRKYRLGILKSRVIDTLGISRYLESSEKYHNLATLVKRYNIPWDEEKHHRADYDAEGTALIFNMMLKKLAINDIKTLEDLNSYPFILIKK